MAENRMVVTRRSLLQISWRTAALAGVASAFQYLPGWKRAKQNLQDLTAESFLPLEGRDLVFARPVAGGGVFSRTVELKLVKVTSHERVLAIESRNPALADKRARKPFSLAFEFRGREPLSEGLHRLIDRLFRLRDLSLAVSRPRPDGTLLYEAVFG